MDHHGHEELLAVEIFKSESLLKPTNEGEPDAPDWGWSRLCQHRQQFYRSLAHHLLRWMTPLPQSVEDTRLAVSRGTARYWSGLATGIVAMLVGRAMLQSRFGYAAMGLGVIALITRLMMSSDGTSPS